jgi:hypothetical protein
MVAVGVVGVTCCSCWLGLAAGCGIAVGDEWHDEMDDELVETEREGKYSGRSVS